MLPIERLEHERHRVAAASAEDDRADRDAFAAFYIQVERGIIADRCREPAVWMRSFFL